jgi:mannan endo-1,4-beta-mannosidase
LDFVISEAKKNGLYVILSLVNNFEDLGGRKQYVQWARDRGQKLNTDDEFYTNAVVKQYYKNHVKVNKVSNVPSPFASLHHLGIAWF